MCNKIFVYGTLKRDGGAYRLMQEAGAKFLSSTQTVPEFTMYQGGFPMVKEGGHTAIKGELFEFEALEDIIGVDRYEGHPELFERKVVQLDKNTQAWMYIFKRRVEYATLVADGTYHNH